MSLVPDYEDSSDSSLSESNSEDENISIKESVESTKNKLPAPNFGQPNLLPEIEESTKSSVFKNPFIEAENAKEAILQKHVKMVAAKDNVVVINGKKICWNYRKGKCRFGHNCKYAHDSDIQKTQHQVEVEKTNAIKNSIVCDSSQLNSISKPNNSAKDGSDDEDFVNKKQKRKRPGLSQGLIPGKKVMKHYMKQKT